MSKPSIYIGVFLNNQSKEDLKKLNNYVPEGWKWFGEHMTTKFIGKPTLPEDFPAPYKEDAIKHKSVELIATHIGISNDAVAVKVEGYPSDNKISHITLAVPQGGKPVNSNYITNWKEISPITLVGFVSGDGDKNHIINETVEKTERIGDRLKKIKTFTTDEGKFSIYDIENNPRRAAMFTVWESPKGWIIRNAFVPDELQKQNIATIFYQKMNDASVKATKHPLRSTQPRTLSSGEVVHEVSPLAQKLWDRLVRWGLAKKIGDKNYQFLKEVDEISDTLVPFKGERRDSLDGTDVNLQAWAAPTMHVKYGGTMTESIIKKLVTEQSELLHLKSRLSENLKGWVTPNNEFVDAKTHLEYLLKYYNKTEKDYRQYSNIYDLYYDAFKDGFIRIEYTPMMTINLTKIKSLLLEGSDLNKIRSIIKIVFFEYLNKIKSNVYIDVTNKYSYSFNLPKDNYELELFINGDDATKNKLSEVSTESIIKKLVLKEITTTFPFNVGGAEATYDSWTDQAGDANKDGEERFLNEIEYTDITKLPFINAIEKMNGKVYQVGGAVRDQFLGKQSKDLDIMVTGLSAEKLLKILQPYGRANMVGESFGVIKFKPHGAIEDIDIALGRRDSKSGEGHKGIAVTTDPSITVEEDLLRRDITINAIAKDIHGNIIDPFGGVSDIKNRIIRMVSPEAFADDPLRMLRCVQFSARFNFTIEPNTFNEIKRHAADIKTISSERILEEFHKIVEKGDPVIGCKRLVETDLYKNIFDVDFKGSYEDFKRVKRMSEFIYLLLKDSVKSPSDFYKNKLKGDINTYKEIKVFELELPQDEAGERMLLSKAYGIAPEAIKSFITQDKLKSGSEHPEEKYPRVASKMAVSGDEIKSLGIKDQFHGMLNRDLLNLIYSDKLENSREAILSYIKQNADKYRYHTKEKLQEITEQILNESLIHFPTNQTFWSWMSPENELIKVPKLGHRNFIARKYKDVPNTNPKYSHYTYVDTDDDCLFDTALKDGWVRVIYEYFPDRFKGVLSINGYDKNRVKEVLNLLYDNVKYGNNTVYIDYENPNESKAFNVGDSEGKRELFNYLNENKTKQKIQEITKKLLENNSPEYITTLTIPKGTKLFHGTGEPFEGSLRGGGYDNILWTTEQSAISQAYIMGGLRIYLSTDSIVYPNQDPNIQNIQRYFGIEYDYNDIKFDGRRATSYRHAPIFGPFYQEYYPTHEKAMTIWKELHNKETKLNPNELADLAEEYEDILKQERLLSPEKKMREYVNQKLEALGYKPSGYGSGDDKNWKIKFNNENIVPADYRAQGRLFIISPKRDMKIYDTTLNGHRDADMTEPDYHRFDWFELAKKGGYDGIKITDLAQSEDMGNFGHDSIGFFKHALDDLEYYSIPASHNPLHSHYMSGDYVSPEYKSHTPLSEDNMTNKPTLILPIGISGSGKSHWINTLPKDQYIIVSPDEIRKELTGSISDQTKNKEVFQLVDTRIYDALSKNKSVILDATNLNTKLRRDFITKIKTKFPDIEIKYKLFDADPNLSKQRIKADIEGGKDRSKVPDEAIDRQYGMYQQTLKDIGDENITPLTEGYSQRDIDRLISALDKYYESTDYVGDAAYIAPDGYMTTLVPKDGASRDDHRSIGSLIADLGINLGEYSGEEWENSQSKWLYIALEMGFIRIIPESNSVEIRTPPTYSQYELLKQFFEQHNGHVYLDLKNDEDSASIEFEYETPVEWIEKEIRRFFYYSEKPRQYGYDDEDLMENSPKIGSIKDIKNFKITFDNIEYSPKGIPIKWTGYGQILNPFGHWISIKRDTRPVKYNWSIGNKVWKVDLSDYIQHLKDKKIIQEIASKIIKNNLIESVGNNINKLNIFDFDGTIANSPLPEQGKPHWEKVTGKPYPHKGWWSKKESLDDEVFNIKAFNNILNEFKRKQSDPNSLTIVMTNRLEKLRPEVENILSKNGISSAQLSMMSDGKSKGNRILEYLKKYPTISRVSFYDDMADNLDEVRSTLKDANVELELFLCSDGSVKKY